MNLDVVRAYMNAAPFVPFDVKFSNGEVHRVKNRDNIAIGKNIIAILDPDSNRMGHCTPHHVVSIEKTAHPESGGQSSNGTHQR